MSLLRQVWVRTLVCAFKPRLDLPPAHCEWCSSDRVGWRFPSSCLNLDARDSLLTSAQLRIDIWREKGVVAALCVDLYESILSPGYSFSRNLHFTTKTCFDPLERLKYHWDRIPLSWDNDMAGIKSQLLKLFVGTVSFASESSRIS
eukprot:scaffold2214_cov139-Cylindrotheca_fusiformis.AAC.36